MDEKEYHFESKERESGTETLQRFNTEAMKIKFKELMERLGEDKRTPAMMLGFIMLIIIGGTLTGHYLKSNSTLEECQESLSEAYVQSAELSNKVNSLEDAKSSLTSSLGNCESQKSACSEDLSKCNSELTGLTSDVSRLNQNLTQTTSKLTSCQKDIYTYKDEADEYYALYSDILDDLEDVEDNYAALRCCEFYDDGYEYYTMDDNKPQCCYEDDDGDYICGIGPNADETDEDDIRDLNC